MGGNRRTFTLGAYCPESTAATEAALRNIPYAQSDLAIGATHGECIPWVWLLCDNGTFDHLVGTLAMVYMVNIREIEPYSVKTGGCVIWLTQKGDFMLKNRVLKDCFVDPHPDLTTISLGRLAREERWGFGLE